MPGRVCCFGHGLGTVLPEVCEGVSRAVLGPRPSPTVSLSALVLVGFTFSGRLPQFQTPRPHMPCPRELLFLYFFSGVKGHFQKHPLLPDISLAKTTSCVHCAANHWGAALLVSPLAPPPTPGRRVSLP